ncbi:MAG: bifunctional demethylmenaquinone methyltransferase/2-methoxy-6-polyprenyl-1,4-benzoquinol methylase UbiE [Candidatus Latescibacterota bacterium]|nr:MAG: bifunctional demethylmenaquinone methyltransferase/2-methoxy-6-polyprenyl-1,4-benzoquinol methylase UbiE [Candidatus Latescibacterota bacterium]
MQKYETSEMFSEIAGRYDVLNHLLSVNKDKLWRKRLVRTAKLPPGGRVLDACTGTGDIAIGFAKYGAPRAVIGLDRSAEMIRVGGEKAAKEKLNGTIQFVEGDVLELPFENGVFDIVTIAFGLRNLPDYTRGVSEMTRVLGHGGKFVILEFSPPSPGVFQAAYALYLRTMVPIIGRIVSGHRQAYDYLASSIDGFLPEEKVLGLMGAAGLKNLDRERLTGGIAVIYSGRK